MSAEGDKFKSFAAQYMAAWPSSVGWPAEVWEVWKRETTLYALDDLEEALRALGRGTYAPGLYVLLREADGYRRIRTAEMREEEWRRGEDDE
jgi:hypothetical protein